MHPKDLSIEDFDYNLPKERIALFPVHPRDSSKLLVYNNGNIREDIYRHLEHYLPQDAVLVFNDTKVIKSRILFTKSTGAVIEIFCLEPHEAFNDYEILFQKTGSALWQCLVGKAGKWKEGILSRDIIIDGQQVTLSAEMVEKLPDSFIIRLSWTPEHYSMGEVIDAAGVTPLPPYIKRKAIKDDEVDYQTVYSEHDGSVAAPTAGLHFTREMMEGFETKGIPTLFTTLHVGAGTFKPVTSDTMEGHIMHKEFQNITIEFLEKLLANIHRTIISVGTTSTRTLESIYWMGNKILNQKIDKEEDLVVGQWEPYEPATLHTPAETIEALIQWIKSRHQTHLLVETGIIIAPGYDYKIIKGLITNFHMPKSTLLLLVSALIGGEWKKMYEYALEHDFRFLSYGDGCLILKNA